MTNVMLAFYIVSGIFKQIYKESFAKLKILPGKTDKILI